jgi:Protein of unknown function (DUF2804)
MDRLPLRGVGVRQLDLPVRGAGVRVLGLPLPPARMPLFQRGRPLKRWRWVGVFGPELMLCVGDVQVGLARQRWWAVALPDGSLREGKRGIRLGDGAVQVAAPGVRISLALEEDEGIEVVSPHGRSWIWTRKQANVPAAGTVALGEREWGVEGEAFVDDSAGYHARHTAWRWSAGIGRSARGERVGWNLVDGVHDDPRASERTVWVDGEPREVGPVEFADDLSRVSRLRFEEWCAREDQTNRLIFRSAYRQPFGTFAGELPGGVRLAHGFGVMERHDVRW